MHTYNILSYYTILVVHIHVYAYQDFSTFSLGTLFMVFSGLRTLRTLRDLMVLRLLPTVVGLVSPLETYE